MAQKTINTRLKLKYDTLANWNKIATTFTPLQGEVCFVEVADNTDPIHNAPSILFKVGDGTTTFGDLKWGSGLAADVYSWAKAANKPSYTATEVGAATISDITTELSKHSGIDKVGTVTSIKINGTTKNPTNGLIDLGTFITDISGKQDKIIAGNHITIDEDNKTINAVWPTASDSGYAGINKVGTVTDVALASGTNNGTLKLTVNGKATDNIAVKGLGSLAYKSSVSKSDVGLGSVENKALDTAVTASSGNYITSGAVKTYVDSKIVASVQYLGTVSSATELAALNPDSAGDFCRVSTAFGSYHAGDLLLCKTVKSGDTAATWDVIHGEIDKDTWVANSKTAAGYVAAGGSNANKVWKTDANGNPAWRDDANTQYGIANSTTAGLVKPGTTNGKIYGVQVDATTGAMTVNVPWTDTNTQRTDAEIKKIVEGYSGVNKTGTVTSVTIKGSGYVTVDNTAAITTTGTRTISLSNKVLTEDDTIIFDCGSSTVNI